MKLHFFLLLPLLLHFSALCTQNEVIWARSYGTESPEELGAMIASADGNVILVGNRDVSEEDTELIIKKIDPQGQEIWEKSKYLPEASLYINDIILSQDGESYLIIGSYRPRITSPTGGNIGKNDYYVMKIDALGNEIWSKTYGGTQHDHGYAIVETSDGYILAGTSSSSDGDVVDHIGFNDYWLVWINENGTIETTKSYGGMDSDQLSSMIKTGDDNLILSGHSHSFINQGHEADFWIIKADLNGEIIWDYSYGGSELEFSPQVIEIEAGNIIIAGQSRSNDFDVPGDNHGDTDFLAIRLDTEGSIVWSKSYGGSGWDRIYAIEEGNNNDFYLGGFTRSNDGNVANNHNGGTNDYWITHIDRTNGTLLWQDNFGGTGGDILKKIVSTANELYIGGYSFSNDIDIDEDNNGSSDYWLLKIGEISTNVASASVNENRIAVYPNPSRNKLILTESKRNGNFQIVDTEGKIINTGEISENRIDISTLPSGTYYLIVEDASLLQSQNQIIEFVKI